MKNAVGDQLSVALSFKKGDSYQKRKLTIGYKVELLLSFNRRRCTFKLSNEYENTRLSNICEKDVLEKPSLVNFPSLEKTFKIRFYEKPRSHAEGFFHFEWITSA